MKSYKKNNGSNKIYNIALGITFVILLWLGYENFTTQYITSIDANTEGRFVAVQSRTNGMISQIYVEKDLEVKKGDLLLEIDSTLYRQELSRKQAELNKLKTRLYFKEHKYEEKDSSTIISDRNQKMEDEEEEEIFPKSKYSTYSKMYDKEIIHLQNKYRKAQIDAEMKAKSESETNNEENKTKEEETDNTTINDLLKMIKDTETQISDIKLAISYTKVYAMQDGIITEINVSDGDYVEVGQSLLSLIPKMVWIIANFPKADDNDIAIGQSVKIEISGYKRKKFKGIVEGIAKNDNQFNTQSVKISFTEDYTDYNIEPGKFATCHVKIK